MYIDDRNEEQTRTHTSLVGGHDPWLSGWGGARGGKSYAYWACEPKHIHTVKQWVLGRKDLIRVGTLDRVNSRAKRSPNHAHVYVVGEGHPALAKAE
jgi:hypothetical protein